MKNNRANARLFSSRKKTPSFEEHESLAYSARNANEIYQKILPHITYGDKVLAAIRSGKFKIREDLKTQFVTDEESEDL